MYSTYTDIIDVDIGIMRSSYVESLFIIQIDNVDSTGLRLS